MKNSKKLPTRQLEKFSTVFKQLGLVLTLFIVYVIIEYETEVKPYGIVDTFNSIDEIYIPDEQNVIFVKKTVDQPKVKTPIPDSFIPDASIEKGDIEDIIFKEPLEKDPIIIEEGDIIVVDEDPIIDEDVPFINIEDAPVFSGCEGLSKKENKICFDKKIKKFVQKNFDAELAQELGLQTGRHKIHTQFIINKKGIVVNIKIRAPHLKLKKEVKRVINKLPQFTPGKQRMKPVKVRYTLPIVFKVE